MTSRSEAEKRATQGKPVNGWINEGNGSHSAVGAELYGIQIVHLKHPKNGREFVFRKAPVKK